MREAWLGLATARRRLGDAGGAAEALAEVRRRHVVGEDAAAVAEAYSIPSIHSRCERQTDSDRRMRARTGWRVGGMGVASRGSRQGACADDPTAERTRAPDGQGVATQPWRSEDYWLARAVSRSWSLPFVDRSGSGKRWEGPAWKPVCTRGPNLLPVPVAATVPRQQGSRRRFPVDVVIPVQGASPYMACLDSVMAGKRRGSRLIVIDDASEEPELVAALDALQRRGRIISFDIGGTADSRPARMRESALRVGTM